MIKKVIQCADIHIRNIHRHEEYAEQLDKFIAMCEDIASQYNRNEVRIVVCGDVVHSKNTISNELIVVASNFLRRLGEIAPTIVFSGNHDLLTNNSSRIDTLTAIFETAQFNNVTFLDAVLGYESGCLVDENIVWTLYSIHDGFRKPDIVKESDEQKVIGLFHGDIVGTQLINGTVMESGVDGDLFDGCDVVMCGHVHNRQELRKGDTTIVYCGSLIQQTYGETVTNHGFAIWDIDVMKYEFINLETTYGLYSFEISNITDIDDDKEILVNY